MLGINNTELTNEVFWCAEGVHVLLTYSISTSDDAPPTRVAVERCDGSCQRRDWKEKAPQIASSLVKKFKKTGKKQEAFLTPRKGKGR